MRRGDVYLTGHTHVPLCVTEQEGYLHLLVNFAVAITAYANYFTAYIVKHFGNLGGRITVRQRISRSVCI